MFPTFTYLLISIKNLLKSVYDMSSVCFCNVNQTRSRYDSRQLKLFLECESVLINEKYERRELHQMPSCSNIIDNNDLTIPYYN